MMKETLQKILLCAVLCTLSVVMVAQERTIEDYLSRSRELYDAGFYREAKVEAGKAQTLSGGSPAIAEQARWLTAKCDAQLGDGAPSLRSFLTTHPKSQYRDEALLLLGDEEHEWERWLLAVEAYESVNQKKMSDAQLDALCFGCGHSYYRLGDGATAREWLSRSNLREGAYYHHSQYLLGVIEYADG
ncbi:MAG: hypothetical protein IKY63_01295, partial [Tidjanibacter sp.]|nr:hypothetical protein [Tidjanibacter sp.]